VEIVARPKSTKPVKKHVFKDPTIEEIVEVEVEFMCPKRGLVKQKVKMKKLKKIVDSGPRVFVGASSIIDDLEKEEEQIVSTDPEE
jgi:hypothetical protein